MCVLCVFWVLCPYPLISLVCSIVTEFFSFSGFWLLVFSWFVPGLFFVPCEFSGVLLSCFLSLLFGDFRDLPFFQLTCVPVSLAFGSTFSVSPWQQIWKTFGLLCFILTLRFSFKRLCCPILRCDSFVNLSSDLSLQKLKKQGKWYNSK